MKSIIITGTDEQLNNALSKEVSNFSKELEIVYASPFSQDLLENASFSQPDYIIADILSEEEVEAILQAVIKTTIVFISNDTNRTNAIISHFNSKGIFDFINLDKNQINPRDVLVQLKDYAPGNFEEVEATTPVSNEVVENPIPQVENVNNLDTNIEVKEYASNEQSNSYTPTDSLDTIPQNNPIFEEKNNQAQTIEKKESSEKIINITQSQLITVYSKKGGTGKTTFAKEIAHVFANATLSKRISSKSNLETIIVDFDFDRGNLRTMLGLTNPNPNVYTLMDAILTKMEQGIPLQRVYFSEPEFKINYCSKVKNTPLYVLPLPQGDIPKRIVERMNAFGDEEIFGKIIKKIIQILKGCFHIIVADTTASYNDVNEILFENSSKIIYPMEGNLVDADNLKVTLDETQKNNYITNKLVVIVNKSFKSRFNEQFLNVYEEIQKEYADLKDIVAIANYDTEVINANNNYQFYTLNQSHFKQVVISACHSVLPIFKTKSLSNDMKIIKKKRAAEKKRAELEKRKEATRKLNAEKTQRVKTSVSTPTNPEVKNETVQDVQVTQATNYREYLSSNLSSKDINTFISDLKGFEDTPLTKKGFPKLGSQPKSLNNKVWKQYKKMLYKNV